MNTKEINLELNPLNCIAIPVGLALFTLRLNSALETFNKITQDSEK
jgi:hypothetical protein